MLREILIVLFLELLLGTVIFLIGLGTGSALIMLASVLATGVTITLDIIQLIKTLKNKKDDI